MNVIGYRNTFFNHRLYPLRRLHPHPPQDSPGANQRSASTMHCTVHGPAMERLSSRLFPHLTVLSKVSVLRVLLWNGSDPTYLMEPFLSALETLNQPHHLHHVVFPRSIFLHLYILPLGSIFRKYGISFHCYADDTQIYIPLKGQDSTTIKCLLNCLEDVKAWMALHFLSFNDSKNEFLLLGPGRYYL